MRESEFLLSVSTHAQGVAKLLLPQDLTVGISTTDRFTRDSLQRSWHVCRERGRNFAICRRDNAPRLSLER